MASKVLRYAVLHVGSSSMSIMILEYKGIDEVTVIDHASREVTYGEELFQTARLSFKTIEEICQVLKGYKQLMADYGVTKSRLYGTTVIREAENRRSILDQIYIQTGLRVEVIDMPKEVYYKYFLLYYDMTHNHKDIGENEALMFLDITSGGVGLTVWQDGAMLFQRNMHSGSLRVMESFKRNERASHSFPKAVAEYLHRIVWPIREELQSFNIKNVVLSGDEARLIAQLMGYETNQDSMLTLSSKEFYKFVDSLSELTATKLANNFKLPEFKANILMPTVILYKEIMSIVGPKKVLISDCSFSEGISWFYGVEQENNPYLYELREQNVDLARAIARRYHTDADHDAEVERFSQQISLVLKNHGLPERWSYLCRIAVILCSVGKFINLRNHGEHAYHIVMGTDIFGLSEKEKEVIANVVYFHYKGIPADDEPYFKVLNELQKIQVTKLVAVIRVACALDASSKQKIDSITVENKDNQMTITAHTDKDISLENWTFKREAEYFTEIFGVELTLNIGGVH